MFHASLSYSFSCGRALNRLLIKGLTSHVGEVEEWTSALEWTASRTLDDDHMQVSLVATLAKTATLMRGADFCHPRNQMSIHQSGRVEFLFLVDSLTHSLIGTQVWKLWGDYELKTNLLFSHPSATEVNWEYLDVVMVTHDTIEPCHIIGVTSVEVTFSRRRRGNKFVEWEKSTCSAFYSSSATSTLDRPNELLVQETKVCWQGGNWESWL